MNEPTAEDREIIAALADELVRRIPALDSLASLGQEATRVSTIGGQVHFEMDAIVRMEDMERAYVAFVLERCQGNKSHAAEALGIDPSTLYRKLGRWGL